MVVVGVLSRLHNLYKLYRIRRRRSIDNLDWQSVHLQTYGGILGLGTRRDREQGPEGRHPEFEMWSQELSQ